MLWRLAVKSSAAVTKNLAFLMHNGRFMQDIILTLIQPTNPNPKNTTGMTNYCIGP